MGNAPGPSKCENLRGEHSQRQTYPGRKENARSGSPIAWRALFAGAAANARASWFLFLDQNNRLSSSRDGFLRTAALNFNYSLAASGRMDRGTRLHESPA